MRIISTVASIPRRAFAIASAFPFPFYRFLFRGTLKVLSAAAFFPHGLFQNF
jgi:hypothetical protein